jgi:hypothetical protein
VLDHAIKRGAFMNIIPRKEGDIIMDDKTGIAYRVKGIWDRKLLIERADPSPDGLIDLGNLRPFYEDEGEGSLA